MLFLAGALAISLTAAALLFGVPGADIPAMALLLVGLGGGLLALLRPAVLGHTGGVRGQLVATSLVCGLLLAGMVVARARAMFLSGHDLSILLTMLLFAALLAVGFSLYGVGLGLVIARGPIEAYGGEIGAENRKGGGSRFYFTLQRG